MRDVTGVIHCHSTYSDGGEPVPVVHRAAAAAGLDYLMMTDHDNIDALHEVGEGYLGNTLLLVGTEVSPPKHHYLAYGVRETPSPDLPPQAFIDHIAAQGGVGFVAHPFDRGSRVIGLPDYAWLDWGVSGFTGIEIWNYFSEWVGNVTSVPRGLCGLAYWPALVQGPDRRTLARWDEIGRQRRVVGIGGMDAHGVKKRVLGLPISLHPYRRAFRALRTHLLLEEPLSSDVAVARGQVLEALREGRAYFANWEEGDPRPFSFTAEAAGRVLPMGAEGEAGPWTLRLRLGAPASAAILRDGQVLAEGTGQELSAAAAGPGVYRAEARRRRRAWLYSNPIYLR